MCLQAERDPQQHSEVRNLIMLDGSPALPTAHTRMHKSCFQGDSIVEKETQALCSYVLQFVDINMMEFSKELKTLPSLADRVKKSVEKISATYKNLQSEDLTLAFDLYYKKLLMSLNCMPRHKLKKEVTLIKASDSLDMTKYISETYDLEKLIFVSYYFCFVQFSLFPMLKRKRGITGDAASRREAIRKRERKLLKLKKKEAADCNYGTTWPGQKSGRNRRTKK
ncbi:hypothetical protein AVEN_152724-1 [Araneus ventricosus]|uniref:Uncharacterized protein n=1 Tax=Araneus ventricosus TaxID=182803 RepID=A0A4Y2KKR8_ARAVE|nr:hypothetical protein AVEN_152724-1 [Araneus ventricosus]